MEIAIDENAGFCFGVTNAIKKAEDEINKSGTLLCLGEMVHNQEEMTRLTHNGMKTISYNDLSSFGGQTVLLRAHGEPPETYQKAKEFNINIIDATCPIVLRLHKIIRENAVLYPNAQTVIFGKKDHAEVIGLNGQVDGKAIIISSANDLDRIDFSKDILLYSQTTMNSHDYNNIAEQITIKIREGYMFKKFNTICRSVANREQNLVEFAKKYNTILFVAGANSSNGKYLFSACKQVNEFTYYIGSQNDITKEMVVNVDSIGITGATSTPQWLLEKVALQVHKIRFEL